MDIKLSNDKHVELVQNINTSAQAVNTDIKLPDLNSNMQGLIGIRNEVYKMKVSLTNKILTNKTFLNVLHIIVPLLLIIS